MFATDLAKRVPHAVEPRVMPQVIDVPVRPRRYHRVMRDAGADASRSEGAAHIDVEPASKLKGSEFPDLNQLAPGTEED